MEHGLVFNITFASVNNQGLLTLRSIDEKVIYTTYTNIDHYRSVHGSQDEKMTYMKLPNFYLPVCMNIG